MKVRSVIIILVVLGMVSLPVFAADVDTSSAQLAASGEAVVSHMFDAYRLPDRLQADMQAVVADGDQNTQATGILSASFPDRFRVDYTEPAYLEGTTILVVRGVAGVVDPKSDRVRVDHAGGNAILPKYFQLMTHFLEPFRGIEPQQVSKIDADGRVTWEVSFELDGVQKILWIDDATGLIVRALEAGQPVLNGAFNAASEPGETWTGTLLGDTDERFEASLQRIEGFWVPARVEVSHQSTSVTETYANMEIKPDLESTFFHNEMLDAYVDYWEKGRQALGFQDYQRAATAFAELVHIDPYDVEGYTNLGYTYLHLEDDLKAASAFEQALMLSPESPVTMNNLAYLYGDTELNIERAVELAERAVSIWPDSPAFLDTLGWAYVRLGKYAAAIGKLQKALDLADDFNPGDKSEMLYHLGAAFEEAGDVDGALEAYRSSIALNPDNHQAGQALQRLESPAPTETGASTEG